MAQGPMQPDAFLHAATYDLHALKIQAAASGLVRCCTGGECFQVLMLSLKLLSSLQTARVCVKTIAAGLQAPCSDKTFTRSCSGISLIKGMLSHVRPQYRGYTAISHTKWHAHASKHRADAANSCRATVTPASCVMQE